ncbi:uncharacterized zinc finger CCHC domain-containing protein At4g19190-like [Olea europaea var. sylvestris]|uniref:uncharacterized zinc finger CCHC domain-containing protein At4g19190-like n=1 Tax=Olea europaea var. sylvestris TaxID=158386 RepID=UPI000C1D1921|nr:uncharacterized zinc finger CCHC domain-containing protein At4g19190-like [Olea europaea var. sylvestris]
MEDDEGGRFKLSKRLSDKEGEVDYKTKAGTAWSHSFLNQKPWHPLSYPNQRRKWIAEQTDAQKQRRTEEVAREYAQEQEFFRQTALVSKKEKEKLEMMKAVSFMYVKPPGYNAESAKAAEVAEERKKEQEQSTSASEEPSLAGAPSSLMTESIPSAQEKKKPRPKDVFGRALPTEEQFEVLKNAPRLETGAPARVKPFGVEIRNVKCLRCGNFGHQSGDRECPLKHAIMPNEENRLKRDDPLTAILAQTNPSEPLKWELKQKPGMSPPRGGFNPDDPNQQIVAEDIFDEYGGFLSEDNLPELLTNFSSSKLKKKSGKSKHSSSLLSSPESSGHQERGSSSGADKWRRSKKTRHKRSKQKDPESSSLESSDDGRYQKRRSRHRHCLSSSSEVSDSDEQHTSKQRHRNHHRHRHWHQHKHQRK